MNNKLKKSLEEMVSSRDFFMKIYDKCFGKAYLLGKYSINEECPGTLSDTEAIMKKLI